MAKRKKKASSKEASPKTAKTSKEQNLYLLAIVSIVAIVGVVVLVLNAGDSTESLDLEEIEFEYDENGDLTGMALYGRSYRMLSKGGAGTACSSHGDCRGGHCNSNGVCA
jgi:hypothetical protein